MGKWWKDHTLIGGLPTAIQGAAQTKTKSRAKSLVIEAFRSCEVTCSAATEPRVQPYEAAKVSFSSEKMIPSVAKLQQSLWLLRLARQFLCRCREGREFARATNQLLISPSWFALDGVHERRRQHNQESILPRKMTTRSAHWMTLMRHAARIESKGAHGLSVWFSQALDGRAKGQAHHGLLWQGLFGQEFAVLQFTFVGREKES